MFVVNATAQVIFCNGVFGECVAWLPTVIMLPGGFFFFFFGQGWWSEPNTHVDPCIWKETSGQLLHAWLSDFAPCVLFSRHSLT